MYFSFTDLGITRAQYHKENKFSLVFVLGPFYKAVGCTA